MDPLAKAYLKVITESSSEDLTKDQKVAGYTPTVGEPAFGDSQSDSTVKKIQKGTGPEAEGAETLETAKEADADLSVGKDVDGKAKELGGTKYEAKNPFDRLFNKILSEEGEMMDFSTADKPEDSTFEPSFGTEGGDGEEFGEEGEGEEDEVTFTLPRELAEKLHEVLGSVLMEGEGEEHEASESEGEEEAEHGFGGSEEGEEESSEEGAKPFGEAVEAEDAGHALVDQEKLAHGLNSKGNYTVKGAVPVTKKSAQTPATGKGHDGKLKAHSTEGAVSKLTAKANDVGGVKVGKTIFDNE
jgi:hypothetical protein